MTKEIRPEDVASLQGLFQEEGRLRGLLQGLVQAALEQEVANHLRARKYERSSGRRGHRNGYKRRQLKTRVGVLDLKLPQVRGGQFQTQLFGKYQRQEAALMTTIAEMYLPRRIPSSSSGNHGRVGRITGFLRHSQSSRRGIG